VWSPSQGCGAPLRTWIPSQGDKALSGRGIILEEMESILGKLSLQIFPASQQLWPQASFPRQRLGRAVPCCAVLGGGLEDSWGWGWGDWYPESMQAESGVSPMKYLLVLCCLFSWGQGCGEEREREGLRKSAGVVGAQLE